MNQQQLNQQQQYIPQAPDMPDMRGVIGGMPMNKRTAAAKAQQEEDDGGWGDTAALLD